MRQTSSRQHRNSIFSLLDNRYICGDEGLFAKLRSRVLPGMVTRNRKTWRRSSPASARTRHERYGQTIFHLEPNIKDGPVACGTIKWRAGWRRSRRWAVPRMEGSRRTAACPPSIRCREGDRLPRRCPVLPPLPSGPRLEWIDLRIAIGGCVRRNRAPGRPHDFNPVTGCVCISGMRGHESNSRNRTGIFDRGRLAQRGTRPCHNFEFRV